MKKYAIAIEGMGCTHCVRGVENALREAGAVTGLVEIGKAEASFAGSPAALKAAIEALDFTVTGIAEI